MLPSLRTSILAVGVAFALLISPTISVATQPAKSKIEFNRDIRPILSDKCFQCHGPDATHRKGKLRLDTDEGARVLVRGKPLESDLFDRITTDQPDRIMPPRKSGKALTKTEIDLIRQWIAEGASFQLHWSFSPPRRPTVPAIAPAAPGAKPRNPIDAFILATLQTRKLAFSAEADKVTLVRRVYFDLLGLPPSPAQVDAFLTDDRPDAYERLVDALLASPHFGERMAMYWLDLVRYADTVGYHGDQEHHISPYRDYVLKAFNDNLPFDRFTIEQLAGDLLPNPTSDQLIATGYNRVLQTTHEGGAQDREYLAIYAADRVRNLSAAWMGATIGCAQCHNHRYDPYTQRDFYRLAAFFADIDERGAYKGPDATPTKRPPEIEVLSPIDRAEAESMRMRISDLEARAKGNPAAKEIAADLARERARLKEVEGRKRLTMITKSVAPRTIRVLHRGDWLDNTGEIVEPGTPHFMKPIDAKGRATRLDLARWLVSPDHPQTARVFVNRLWYLFFGTGLSKTLEDAGSQGEWPTHPELLDWLAVEFMEGPAVAAKNDARPWNVKHVIRLMVTSATYRQASTESAALRQLDPENRLYARQSRFRLPAEMIRDQALAVSGLLADRVGGKSAKPYQPEGYYAFLNFPKRTYVADKGLDQYRRGLYTHWQRTYLHPMLKAFDAPTREECTAQRPISNTPLAALALLNDPSILECARVFAVRIIREGGKDRDERIRWAWRQALSRTPEDREIAALFRLIESSMKQYSADPQAAVRFTSVGLTPRPADINPVDLAAWTAVARVLFNLDEIITRN